MSLRDHLLELRNRLIKSLIGLAAGAIAGWFLYPALFSAISQPLTRLADERGFTAGVNFQGVVTPFDIQLQAAFFIGAVISSPIWIYQLWAFITPGLTRKERGYTFWFMLAAIPLFLSGIYCGWLVMPNIVYALVSLTPQGGANYVAANDYVGFIMQLVLFMGIAFLIPVVLIALNLTGILRGKTMFKGWRFTVLGVTVVAAMAAPGNDVFTMFLLGIPLLALYFGSMGICVLLDRRRDKRAAKREAETAASADTPTDFDDLGNV